MFDTSLILTTFSNLRETREQHGVSQEQLARAAGLPVGVVRSVEQGHKTQRGIVERIFLAFGPALAEAA